MGKLAVAEEIVKKWMAPMLVGTAAATESEDAEAGFGGLRSLVANRAGAEAAMDTFDRLVGQGLNPMDPQDAAVITQRSGDFSELNGRNGQRWFVGADRLPRYEFNDAGASINRSFDRGVQNQIARDLSSGDGSYDYTLGELLNHRTLFNAYPEVQDLPTFIMPEGKIGAVASYLPPGIEGVPDELRNGAMMLDIGAVRNSPREETLKSILHETQHHIQNIEGFAPGANANMPPKETLMNYLDRHADELAMARESDRPGQYPAYAKGQYMYSLIDDALKMDEKYGGDKGMKSLMQELYQMSHGEAEARAVEARLRMSPAERRARTPALDYKYHPDEGDYVTSLFELFD